MGAAPRPSRHLETYLTETWARGPSGQLGNDAERAGVTAAPTDLCLVIGSWSEVKESELLYPSPSWETKEQSTL